LGRREVRGGRVEADDRALSRAPALDSRDPAVRGLRPAEVRGVDARSAPAARDPTLQLQAPPRVGRRTRTEPEGSVPVTMRGLLPFFATRLLRAAIALWLVSTVVFVVMRLSGDPVPLLLPPDAPISEMNRVRRELGLASPDRKR